MERIEKLMYTNAINDLSAIENLQIDDEDYSEKRKILNESLAMYLQTQNEKAEVEKNSVESKRKVILHAVEVAATICVPVIGTIIVSKMNNRAFNDWFSRMLTFEIDGTVTSVMGRSIVNKLIPKR